MLDQAVDQVVIFPQQDQLKGRPAVDRHHHELIVAELSVTAQVGLGLAEWNEQ
jgi:hypothetical protein